MARLFSLGIYLYLSLYVLLPATAWEESVKLPQLVRHYLLHKQQEPDHSLLDFLMEHYGDQDDHHAQKHDHTKIPFKAPHATNSSSWSPVYLPGSFYTGTIHFPHLFAEPKVHFHYALAAFLEPLLSFWQPPKL